MLKNSVIPITRLKPGIVFGPVPFRGSRVTEPGQKQSPASGYSSTYAHFSAFKKADHVAAGRNVFARRGDSRPPEPEPGKNISPGGARPLSEYSTLTVY
ncbi:hypothetical protein C4J81_16125 [Deltaproteobacteria bacterium Smac51]|nr:hypothetical protein C4J81_16125 [Deltaproteobacteria bacterium Smac51]